MKRFLFGCTTLASLCALPSLAQAQTDTGILVQTAIPDNYDRDRNISVLERPRPEYDPLGIRYATLLITPQVETGAGATNNIYLRSVNERGDGYVYVAPSVQATSDWARDQLMLSASGLGRRYFDQTRRNETSYNLRGLGRKDIGSAFSVTGEAQYAKLYETPESGAIDPALSVLSSYQRSFFSARGQYRAGVSRVIIALDRTAFTFADIDLGATEIDQSDRDRVISRITGEYQYALSPSVSVYGQSTYDGIDYSRRLAGGAENRDSNGFRIIGGVNFDLAGLMRGKIGVGYINRDFKSAAFRDVDGLSAEAVLEYFQSPLTTFTLGLSRRLDDASVNASGAYFENRVQLRVDHELRYNLIVGAAGEYRHQSFVDSPVRADYYRASANARYLSSRFLALTGTVSYLRRGDDGGLSSAFDELRAQVGIILRR